MDRTRVGRFFRGISSKLSVFWTRLSEFEKFVLIVIGIISATVIVTYSWGRYWPLGFHSEWKATYVASAVVICLLLVVRLSSRQPDVRHSLEAMAASFTTLAVVATGYWYFYERPGVPKINLSTSVEAWPIGEGMAAVRIEMTIENVGSTVVEFKESRFDGSKGPRDDRIKIDLGRVLPFDPEYKSNASLLRAGKSAAPGAELELVRTSQWPPLARNYHFSKGEIEAGETEKYYYKAVVPCVEGMVLASSVRIPKVGRLDESGKNLVWLAQSLSEPIAECR